MIEIFSGMNIPEIIFGERQQWIKIEHHYLSSKSHKVERVVAFDVPGHGEDMAIQNGRVSG